MRNFIVVLCVALFVVSCKKEIMEPDSLLKIESINHVTSGTLVQGQKDALLYTITLNSPTDVAISEIQLLVQAGGSFKNNLSFFIAINDVLMNAKNYYGEPVSFLFDNLTLKSSKGMTIKIYAIIQDSVKKGESISLSLGKIEATDILSGAKITDYAKPIGATFIIK
jgi:hypothetical protein